MFWIDIWNLSWIHTRIYSAILHFYYKLYLHHFIGFQYCPIPLWNFKQQHFFLFWIFSFSKTFQIYVFSRCFFLKIYSLSFPKANQFKRYQIVLYKMNIGIYINIIIYPKLCKSTRVLAEWGEVPGFLLATTFQSSQTSGVMWSLKYQQSFAALMIPRAANEPQSRRRPLLGSSHCWKHQLALLQLKIYAKQPPKHEK